MSKFYIIDSDYASNSAPANRLLSFVGAFDSNNITTEVVFISPNYTRDKVEHTYKNVTFRYLWDGGMVKSRIYDKLLAKSRVIRFRRHLKKGDNVLLFGAGAYLHYFTSRQDINVYHERTEHPDIVRLRFGYERKRYLKNCKKVSGLFVISTVLKQYFASIGVSNEKITIVNMTVDPKRFEGVKKEKIDDKYIAYCGTVSNNKDGVDKLIEAFAIVTQKHPDIKLYIIGKTPSQNDQSGNMKLVESLGLKNKIFFTGTVAAKDMPQLLTNATALALARPDNLQAQNGFPTKLGEYLLTGNPVVITKVGDIPLFLKDGDSALLAEAGNSQEFADKLNWVLEHPQEAKIIGANGRQVALQNFDSAKETQKIIQLIFGKGND